jgi:hypothetical protein
MRRSSLTAVVRTYLGYVAGNTELVAMSETSSPGARLRTGSHQFWRQHCEFLLASAAAPDAGLRTGILLAGLTAEQIGHCCTTRAGLRVGWPTRWRTARSLAETSER